MPIHDHLRDKDPRVNRLHPIKPITRTAAGPITNGATSRIQGCLFHLREDEIEFDTPMFYFSDDGKCKVDLVGYAIIPMEVYNGLLKISDNHAFEETKKLLGSLKTPKVSRYKKVLTFIKRSLKFSKSD